MQQRTLKTEMKVREDNGSKKLSGYFAVFDKPYEVMPGWVETIAPGAFSKILACGQDVKVLWNHNRDIVLGSTANKTAYLREDEIGLWGDVVINEHDQDAKNAYARIDRGDVNGCSFGFEIAKMEESWDDDGTYHTRILEVYPLHEVSPCTFPAYTQTNISARNKEWLEQAKTSKREAWKNRMLSMLKGETNGT